MTNRPAPRPVRSARWFSPAIAAAAALAVPLLGSADPYRPGEASMPDAGYHVPAQGEGDVQAAVVSAKAGQASNDLAMGSRIHEGQAVATGDTENLALVLEDDALLELCARSVVTLQRHAVRKAQIVKLDAGEARFVVSPRTPDQRIEVHTPSAIATILGTVVMVKVDPLTGETTVTTEKNAVEVRSSDPSIPGRTRVVEGEQCTVKSGDAPTDAKKLPREAFATLGDCLMDLENAALANDRIARRKKDLEKIAKVDGGDVNLPGVGTPGDTAPGVGGMGGIPAPTDPDAVIDPTTDFNPPPPAAAPPVIPVGPPPQPGCNGAACIPGFP